METKDEAKLSALKRIEENTITATVSFFTRGKDDGEVIIIFTKGGNDWKIDEVK